MEYYAAIDVSLGWSSVCIVDAGGQIAREARVRSEREALVGFFAASGLRFAHIGLEAGPLSQWLHACLVEAGWPAVCIETRHVKAALKAMTVKTDKNDARGSSRAKPESARSTIFTRGQRPRIWPTIRSISATAPAEASMFERRSLAASRC